MLRKLVLLFSLLLICAMSMTSCTPAPAAEPEQPAASNAAEAEVELAPANAEAEDEPAPANAEAAAEPAEKVFLAMVLHENIPYTMQIKTGFEDFCALHEDDLKCEYSAPETVQPEQSIAMFQDFVTKGAQGVVVNCVPQDTWVQPIKQAIADNDGNLLVNSVDVNCLPESDFNVQVGPLYEPQGKEFAKAFFDALAAKGETAGQVVFGICAPGYPSQELRDSTFAEECEARGGYECIHHLDTGHAADLNYTFWENAVTKYPDAVAFAGACSFDGPNLFKLKQKIGADWYIGTYDLEPETLNGLQSGDIIVGIGNNPHLNGFLAGELMYNHIKDGTALAKGSVISTTSEIVTYETIGDFMAREESPEARLQYTLDLVESQYEDPDSSIQVLPE